MPDSANPSADSIQTLLAQAGQVLSKLSDTALLDAEVLLCHCLQKPRTFLRAWPEHCPSHEQIARFQALIAQRQQGMPVAYLTGQREFWSRNFRVSPAVLIPRPDTELLIELSLDRLPPQEACKILDLGTGSGILAITLAAERPLANVIATDISLPALKVAEENAKRLQTPNVRFLQSHWFQAINDREFDLIVSNPPYIEDNDPHLQAGDVRFEPQGALVSPDNGLQDIRQIAEQARQHLKPGGHLLIEHGYNQQAPVQALFKALNYRQVQTHTDLGGNPRVTSGLWKPL